MKRLAVFMAVAGMIFMASLSFAEDYKVIRKISVPENFEEVSSLTLSPDGSKVAYVARSGGKNSVWLNDEKVSHEVDHLTKSMNRGTLVFSPNGDKVAYWANEGGKYFMMVNERRISPELDSFVVRGPIWSPDSSKVAYGTGWVTTINDIATNTKKIIKGAHLTFSPDGNKMAYVTLISGEQIVMVNEERMSPELKIPPFDDRFYTIGPLTFSPDGSKLAYAVGYSVHGSFVMVGKRRVSPKFKEGGIFHLTFSPDSKKIAYMVVEPQKKFIVIDDRKVSPDFSVYDYIGPRAVPLAVSPDGNKVAYSAGIHIPNQFLKKYFVMVNDKKISPELGWLERESVTFSPNGSKVVYSTDSAVWINDRRVSPEFDEVAFASEHFKKTGELVFAGYDKEKREILHAVSLVTEAVKKVEGVDVSTKVETPSEVLPSKRWLGVAIQDVTPELAKSFGIETAKGALVSNVEKGGPADTAGIKTGDIILEFNRNWVKESKDLPKFVSETEPGKKVAVLVWRDGNKFYAVVTVGERPAGAPAAEAEPSKSAPPGMVFVKGGCFQMGDTFGEGISGFSGEKPVHEVCVGDFYIGKYEVTQKEWQEVMGTNPSYFKGCSDCPVELVTWIDVQEFIEKLNTKTGRRYRLPTDAEWEYAAREGGKRVRFGTGKDTIGPDEANFNASAEIKVSYSRVGVYRAKTTPVGSFAPNGLGLYDMTGNVEEWVSDWYDEDYYKRSPRDNPQGPSTGKFKALRGGSWRSGAWLGRAAFRKWYGPGSGYSTFGFRLALSAQE